MEYKFHNYTIQRQMSKCIIDSDIFAVAVADSEILVFNFLPSKSRSSSLSTISVKTAFNGNWRNLQISLLHFTLAVTVFEIFTFSMFDLREVGKGHKVQFSHWVTIRKRFVQIYKILLHSFSDISYRFRYIILF